MTLPKALSKALDRFPKVSVAHCPTPIEALENLGREIGVELYVKRDDCTGLGFGGNKVRQLEFYLGAALAENADTLLITGAVQSNFVRTAAAMAGRFGLRCHIQLEERVTNSNNNYRENGNVLLDKILGAELHSYQVGEDENGADAALDALAEKLRYEGCRPYNVYLSAVHPPLGAIGYILAAAEFVQQQQALPAFDEIVVCSGSALTHTGLLFGLRAMGQQLRVQGICVRRAADRQHPRVSKRLQDLADLLAYPLPVAAEDVRLYDGSFAPGYGVLNEATQQALRQTAQLEGLFLDPVYTGKAMAALIQLVESGSLAGKRVLFWHTGGQPALFAYADQLGSQQSAVTRNAYNRDSK